MANPRYINAPFRPAKFLAKRLGRVGPTLAGGGRVPASGSESARHARTRRHAPTTQRRRPGRLAVALRHLPAHAAPGRGAARARLGPCPVRSLLRGAAGRAPRGGALGAGPRERPTSRRGTQAGLSRTATA